MTTPASEELLAGIMLIALSFYALLGGADFGAGLWDLLARGPRAHRQRDTIAHAIGPVWEANHVWLILVVVLLFTAFPAAFAAIMTVLHVPLSLMLFGIVIRGSAFTFRSYDNTALGRDRWNRAFAIPSILTPILLGAVVGAIASGHLPDRPARVADLFAPWLAPFPIAVGLFTLMIFAYLAAVYLTMEADEPDLQDDFRRRALFAAVAVGVLAWAVYLLARSSAPEVFLGLNSSPWGFPVRVATGACAIAALAGLWTRRYRLARSAAMLQVVLILWGCAIAQAPYLVPPRLTVRNAAAPPATLRFLLVALGCGAIVLFPSIYYLFRVFKRQTIAARGGGAAGDRDVHSL